MEKIFFGIIILIIIIIIYGLSYLYLGGFLVGYNGGHFIIYKYTCADLCPQYGSWSKKYFGDIDENACIKSGGTPEYITMAGVVEHGYNGCNPE